MFGKKRNSIHHAAHIKGNTKGTSNEISFSVLDAAKMSMDNDPNELSDDVKGFGKISLFTLGNRKKHRETPRRAQGLTLPGGGFVETGNSKPEGGTSGLPSGLNVSRQTGQGTKRLSPAEAEISRRKANRRKSNKLKILIGCLAVVVLAAIIGFSCQYIYNQHQTTSSTIDNALRKVVQADITLVKMDLVLTSPIDESTLESIENLDEELQTAETNLSEAEEMVRQVQNNTTLNTDADTTNYAAEAIAKRKTMLDCGKQLLEKVCITQESFTQTQAAYDQIYVADALAREAARYVSGELKSEKVIASHEKLKAAIEELSSARSKLEVVQQYYPIDEVNSYIEYVSLRISALEHGVASDEALLADNLDLALQENDLYTELDSKAAGIAAQFPSDWLEPIRNAFDKDAAPQVEAYEKARSEAGVTDAFLRNYLGTRTK